MSDTPIAPKQARCTRINIFRPGAANVYCLLLEGHDGKCRIPKPCGSCRTGHTREYIEIDPKAKVKTP